MATRPSWLDPRRRIAVRHFAGPAGFADAYTRPLRIAHITDQHVGFVTPESLQRAAVELVNEQNPDLVVLTGDYVAHSLDYLDLLEDVLRNVDAPMIGVMGNHDHWSGADGVRAALKRAGVLVLDNAWTEVELGNQRLRVVGLDDAYTGHADIEKATIGLDGGVPVLGLSHIAEEADELWRRGASLVLSGHTHSGQVTVGQLHHLTLGRLAGHKYLHGLYGCRHGEQADGAVYVSAGIGAAVFGLRIGERSRPEVPVFDLGAHPSERDEHHAEQPPHPAGREVTPELRMKRRAMAQRKLRRQHRARQMADDPLLGEDG